MKKYLIYLILVVIVVGGVFYALKRAPKPATTSITSNSSNSQNASVAKQLMFAKVTSVNSDSMGFVTGTGFSGSTKITAQTKLMKQTLQDKNLVLVPAVILDFKAGSTVILDPTFSPNDKTYSAATIQLAK